MASLKDIVAFILARYPHKDELSTARVTKMVYLADWKFAIDHGRQMTSIDWYFDNYGPFVWDVANTVQESPDVFGIEHSTTMFGDRKRIFRLAATEFRPALSTVERQTLEHVIDSTKDLSWNAFIKLVYSTFPVISSDRYSPLNLVAMADEYKATG